METALRTVNALISALFFICYAYQFLYIPLVLAKKQRPLPCPPSPHRYAVLIAARNESAVIGGLLDSLRQQTYDPALLTVFVAADNCTDDTAAIARRHGAVVYERFNHVNVGKGYALDFLTQHIKADYPDGFDGYFVFDADNILAPDYIEKMNAVFSNGYEIVTSYRNSKNYADNWISAGYGLWFLRESRYLNGARMRLGSSAAVGGTGFLFSQRILDKTGGWRFYLLTEDGKHNDLWVQDNGMQDYEGIGLEDAEPLFDPFINGPEEMKGLVYDDDVVASKGVHKGIEGSISSTIKLDEVQTNHFTFTLSDYPIIQDNSKLRAFAVLLDTKSGKVVNVNECKVKGVETGISDNTAASKAVEVARYTADGQQVSQPVKGVNIVRYSDGRVVKTVVR